MRDWVGPTPAHYRPRGLRSGAKSCTENRPPVTDEEAAKVAYGLLSSHWDGSVGSDEEECAPPVGRWADPFFVRFKTRLLDYCSTKLDRSKRLGAVRKLEFHPQERKMAPGHSHPKAAADRSDASAFLSYAARKLGVRRYDVSVAARELRGLAVGSRQYRSAKDLLSDAQYTQILDTDFVTMVDTDYYMTEAEFSNYAGHDIGIYALRPDALSKVNSDSIWYFKDQHTVAEEVSGGAVYEHQVWDWGKDLLILGRGCKTFFYDPVVFPVGEARIVVVLVLARVVHLPRWLVRCLVSGAKQYYPSRMEVHKHGEFLVGEFGPMNKRRVHVKAIGAGTEESVSVSTPLFRSLLIASGIPNTDKKVPKVELLPAAVQRLANSAGEPVSVTATHVLSRYFTHAYKPFQLVNYQSVGPDLLEDGTPTTVLAAVPLVGPGCAPVSSANNENRAIQARVLDVANNTPFPEKMIQYGKEFAELVVPRPYKGVPWSMEELREQQNRPCQVERRLKEEIHTMDLRERMTTTSFQKAESGQSVSDPRLINQVSTDHTNRLCCYSGAVKQGLKSSGASRWYYVGKKPHQVALGLQGFVRHLDDDEDPEGGDYSRMDGRTSVGYRRNVHKPVYMRFFAKQYHSELEALLTKEETATTRTRKFGVRANMGGANLSGSGITTDLNTLDAAFNEYVARREAGESPRGAYMKLGCYFGDDSVVSSKVFPLVVQVATSLGMKLVAEQKPAGVGRGYVVFLSRVYPDITTSLASHPCIVRALRKMCMVMANPTTTTAKVVRLKLRLKVEGVLTSDPHVPVLSDYARALKRVYKLDGNATAREWEAAIADDKTYQYKREAGAYPSPPDAHTLLIPSIATELETSPSEVQLLMQKLQAAQTEDDLVACATGVTGPMVPEWASWVPTPVPAGV